MALPFLPGNSFSKNVGKTKFHKSHHFDYENETALMVGASKPGIGGELLLGQKFKPRNTVFPKGEGSSLPSWIAFDRQVLCFDAYYQEAVHEKREEQYRVRTCKIYLYLEDDSIQVIEPRLKNSGIPQGTLIKRHRIPRPAPNDDEFYTAEDFNIGSEVNLYSRVFKITDCDQFTQNFLRKMGTNVQRPNKPPEDPYMNYRKAVDESMQPLRPYEKFDSLKQFLDHDQHVLRFYCQWDDTDNMFGDVRQLVLHYFLADDTIEIREIIPPNAGRDTVSIFLKRGKLPKHRGNLPLPGVVTDRTVLNVFGPAGAGSRYILDNLKTGEVNSEFYNDRDLSLGSVVSIWGRKVIICDCDNFTREYYKTKYGIVDMTPVTTKEEPAAPVKKPFPPFNGFGSEEDSQSSCKGLMPKPPKKDFIKFMEYDSHGLESNILRFMARLDTNKSVDQDRRFIISYYLSDDSIIVFEPPIRNSGIIGGKFLERGRIKKPPEIPYNTEVSPYFTATDLYVGATVEFNKFKFILLDADEYALKFMEENSNLFVRSNINVVLEKLSTRFNQNKEDVRGFFARTDPKGTGSVCYDKFRDLIIGIDPTISEHEVLTVARQFSDRRTDVVLDVDKLKSIIQEELRRKNFEGFGELLTSLRFLDKDCLRFLTRDVIRKVFFSQNVPLPDDMLQAALSIAKTADNNNEAVMYEDFVNSCNWRDFPAPAAQYQSFFGEDGVCGPKPHSIAGEVYYQALLQHIFKDSQPDGV